MFILVFSSLFLVFFEDIISYFKIVKNVIKKLLYILVLLLVVIIMVLVIYKFIYVYEYLFVDNRYYLFYIWRKVYVRYWSVKYVMVLLYMFAVFCIYR